MPFTKPLSLSSARPKFLGILLCGCLFMDLAHAESLPKENFAGERAEESGAEKESPQSQQVKIGDANREILIPESLWERAEIKEDDHVTFFNVAALLSEKTPGVLTSKQVQILFPLGGGTLDLDRFVNKDKIGSYYLSFQPTFEGEEEVRQVFFLSNGRRRKFENSIAGSGCRHILKMNPKFLDHLEKEPLLLTNHKHLDVTMLAGSFIFITRKKKNVFISQITITSSSESELLCEVKETHD